MFKSSSSNHSESLCLDGVWLTHWYFLVLTDWQWRPWSIPCLVFLGRAQPSSFLPSPCPACLPISHPSWAWAIVYITIIEPCNPHFQLPCPHSPTSHYPACSQSWHGTISNLPPPWPVGLRRTSSPALLSGVAITFMLSSVVLLLC